MQPPRGGRMDVERLMNLELLLLLCLTWSSHHLPTASAAGRGTFVCPASAEAKAALKSVPPGMIWNRTSTGYQFQLTSLEELPPTAVGTATSVNNGVIFIPEEGVDPDAYVPYAISAAGSGRFAAVVQRAETSLISALVVDNPRILTWSLVAHGIKAGEVAADFLVALYPKVTAIALVGSLLPGDVNLSDSNMAVFVCFGNQDTVVPPSSLAKSAPRLPGDTFVSPPINASHYDFAYTTCGGNKPVRGSAVKNRTAEIASALQPTLSLFLLFQPWPAAAPRAFTFADNEKLTPGNKDSKPYPIKGIRVTFSKQLIPGLTAADPPRSWFIFTPSRINCKGGLVYFPGAAIPIASYFPIAFEIAARGHLVVLVQQQSRFALPLGLTDTDIVIDKGTFPGVKHWAVGAHSVGGRTATSYAAGQEASRHPTRKVCAVVLHAGAVTGNLSASSLPVLQIFGTLDQFSPPEETYRFNLLKPPAQGGIGLLLNAEATEFHEITGADHPQVGEYGSPGIATISSREEQFIFAEKTAQFLDKHIPHS